MHPCFALMTTFRRHRVCGVRLTQLFEGVACVAWAGQSRHFTVCFCGTVCVYLFLSIGRMKLVLSGKLWCQLSGTALHILQLPCSYGHSSLFDDCADSGNCTRQIIDDITSRRHGHFSASLCFSAKIWESFIFRCWLSKRVYFAIMTIDV